MKSFLIAMCLFVSFGAQARDHRDIGLVNDSIEIFPVDEDFNSSIRIGAPERITCSSKDFKYKTCRAEGRVLDAVLVRQLSDSACIEGVSWGWDRRSIWVDRGCRAVFEAYVVQRDNDYPTPRPDYGMEMACGSRDFRYNTCEAPFYISEAILKRQLSDSSCIRGRTWGIQGNRIWVDRGCRAIFKVY